MEDASDTIARFASDHAFSGVVAVGRGGELDETWSFGQANRELSLPNGPATRFQIGSISKWVATVALLTLVDDGVLDLDAPIGTYLTGYPAEAGSRVTLVHLLSNTSGIEDRLPFELINDPRVAASELSAAEAVDVYGRGPLSFAPGSAFDYSHTNWLIVQAIVEAVACLPLEHVLAERLFLPLDLRATGVVNGPFDRLPNAAIAYASADEDAPRKLHTIPRFLVATGTIYSDCADLIQLAHAVYHGSLLRPASREALTTVRHAPEDYALGGRVVHATVGGATTTVALELGSAGGFKAMLAHAIAADVTVAALNNTHCSQTMLTELARAVLATL